MDIALTNISIMTTNYCARFSQDVSLSEGRRSRISDHCTNVFDNTISTIISSLASHDHYPLAESGIDINSNDKSERSLLIGIQDETPDVTNILEQSRIESDTSHNSDVSLNEYEGSECPL